MHQQLAAARARDVAASCSARCVVWPSSRRQPQRRAPPLLQPPRAAATNAGATPGTPQQTATTTTTTPGTPAAPQFPPYSVVRRAEGYDLRLYAAYAVVECDYTRRDEAYEKLGAYAGGANAAQARFGFTAPMVMCYEPSGRKRMQLMVGAPHGGGTTTTTSSSSNEASSSSPSSSSIVGLLPQPTDPEVRLAVAGGELIAALRFSGAITPDAAAAARERLAALLAADGLALAPDEAAGLFRCGQFGAIHTLEERTNELYLAVAL